MVRSTNQRIAGKNPRNSAPILNSGGSFVHTKINIAQQDRQLRFQNVLRNGLPHDLQHCLSDRLHNHRRGKRARHLLSMASINHTLLNKRSVHGGPISTPACDLWKRAGAAHSDAEIKPELAIINRVQSAGSEIRLRLRAAHAPANGARRSQWGSDLTPAVHAGTPR